MKMGFPNQINDVFIVHIFKSRLLSVKCLAQTTMTTADKYTSKTPDTVAWSSAHKRFLNTGNCYSDSINKWRLRFPCTWQSLHQTFFQIPFVYILHLQKSSASFTFYIHIFIFFILHVHVKSVTIPSTHILSTSCYDAVSAAFTTWSFVSQCKLVSG